MKARELDAFACDKEGLLILPAQLLEKFWAKVDKRGADECWEWMGAKASRYGHGCFSIQRTSYLAHRISYLMHCGPIPKAMVVRHACDFASCVNPRHLKLGTQRENIREMIDKGRANFGRSDGTFGHPPVWKTVSNKSRMPHPSPQERFMRFVSAPSTDGQCWLWTGTKDGKGYGRFKSSTNTTVTAHRASYQFFIGPVPGGLHVLHRCDSPSCVNPDHLFLGTNAENVADKVAKGRCFRPTSSPETYARWYASFLKGRPRGAAHGRYTKPESSARGVKIKGAVLDDDKVRAIRLLSANGMRSVDIARQLDVRKNVISRVLTGKTWKHVS